MIADDDLGALAAAYVAAEPFPCDPAVLAKLDAEDARRDAADASVLALEPVAAWLGAPGVARGTAHVSRSEPSP